MKPTNTEVVHGGELMSDGATPTQSGIPLRSGDFLTLTHALEYAAQGGTGCNFYTSRGKLSASISYYDLYHQSCALAKRLLSLDLDRGDRVAIVADTSPDFLRFFFYNTCWYCSSIMRLSVCWKI